MAARRRLRERVLDAFALPDANSETTCHVPLHAFQTIL
jgi:hypothetical protein